MGMYACAYKHICGCVCVCVYVCVWVCVCVGIMGMLLFLMYSENCILKILFHNAKSPTPYDNLSITGISHAQSYRKSLSSSSLT